MFLLTRFVFLSLKNEFLLGNNKNKKIKTKTKHKKNLKNKLNSNNDLDLIKSFSQIHLIAKNNLALDSIKCLNTYLQGHGVGKEVTNYEGSVNKLLETMNSCQIDIDKTDLNDCLFSVALDENTTRHKCASAIMIRCQCCFLLYLFFFCFILFCIFFYFVVFVQMSGMLHA